MSPYSIRQKKRPIDNPFVRVLLVGITLVIVWFILRTLIRPRLSSIPVIYTDVTATALSSRSSLIKKVTELQGELAARDVSLAEHAILLKENETLKAELGRVPKPTGVLAHVISFPNRSFYDTMTIDAGAVEHISEGQKVYAFGLVPLGTVASVSDHSASVLLYSAPGRETTGTAVGSDVAVTLIGRGNGEYEVRMPRDVHFDVGGLIAEQSVEIGIMASIEKIVTDPRDPFQRLLAKTPVNLQALKWVIVR
jgi:cell shape-determining protein MreC